MKISNHCYAITGLAAETPWVVNSGFVVGDHTTLIVDTGSNYLSAQTIHGYVNSVNPNNALIIVNTEPHFDHIGGNCYFSDKGIDIYAHAGLQRSSEDFENNKHDLNDTIANPVRRAAREADAFFLKTKMANPNIAIADGHQFDLGSVVIQVIETPGHTPCNLSLYLKSDQVLFTGDCIVGSYLPNLEIGREKDWNAWLHSLDKIEALNPLAIVPGHGDIVTGRSQIKLEIARTRKILKTAIQEAKAPTAMI